MPTVIFGLAVMSIIAVAALSTSSDERRASRAVRESTMALYAAEAGLRQTYGAWPKAPVKALNPGDSLDLGWQTLSTNSSYRTVIHRMDKGGIQEYNVVVQGRRTGLNGGVSTILGVVGGVPVFTYGVYAKTNISLGGNGRLDGYDSEQAPYDALTADSTANLWSNGTMDINRTTVLGNASATGSITTGTGVNVTGGLTSGADPAPPMDINACPATGFTPAANVPNGAGISYNASTGVLSVAAGAVVNLTGSQYFFSRVILQGNSSITVNPPAGSRVEVIVSDSVNLSGGSVTNLSGVPTRLGFSSCGSPTPERTWVLTGGSGAAFSVYAPNHPVIVTGGGDLFGAVVSSSYTATGGAELHYDAALARIGADKLIVHRATWAMLPGG
ncbi:MAG: pilus assembly PilX N-terminal domain-containing protein [Gemmatimonadaceae bacterium]